MTVDSNHRRARQAFPHFMHLLVEYPPKVAVPALVNSLKGVPTRRLRPEFTGRVNRHTMHGHFWSPSYPTSQRPAAARR